MPAVKTSKQSWSLGRSASNSRGLRETALAPPSPESYPPHPVDLVKSPQISAAAAGLDCGQSSVAPPSDVPKSSEREKRNRVRDAFLVVSLTKSGQLGPQAAATQGDMLQKQTTPERATLPPTFS